MQITALLLSTLSAGALAEVSNSSSQGMQSTETAAALLWEGSHSSALPGPTGFQTAYRAVNISVAQPPVEFASALQSMGDCETHPCQKFGKQLGCRTECMFTGLFTPKKCFNKCMKKCYKKHPLHPEEEAEETLVERSEDAVLATAEAHGLEIDPCGYTMQAWCTYKAYATWWFMGGFEHVYEKCMAKCGPSQITN